MATALELLSTDSSEEAYRYAISEDFRTVTIPAGQEVWGCVGDECVRRIWFEGPAECDGTDLSDFTVSVMYVNAGDEEGRYFADDVEVSDGKLVFSWLLERPMCRYSGFPTASVNMRKLDGDEVLKEFNSTVFSGEVKRSNQTESSPSESALDEMAAWIEGNQEAIDSAVSAASSATSAASSAANSANGAAEAANEAAANATAAADGASTAAQHAEEAAEAAVTNVRCYYTTEQSGDDTVLALVYDLVTE